jgi:AraC family chemosensory pili system transcriptional regulator ChpD
MDHSMEHLLHGTVGRFHVAQCFTARDSNARHTHDSFTLSARISGGARIWLEGRSFDTGAGDITLYNPNELHGATLSDRHTSFATLHVAPADMFDTMHREAVFRQPVLRNPPLADALVKAIHTSLSEDGMVAAMMEEHLLFLLSAVATHDGMRAAETRQASGGSMAERIKQLLADNLATNIALDDIAAQVGMSKFHVLRAFKADVGLTPREWAMQLRMQKAAHLLRQGQTATDVAATLGFVDQSHLNKHFLKWFGVTPGKFRRSFSGRVRYRQRAG